MIYLQGDSAKCAQILFLVLCTCISSIINFQLLTFQFLIIYTLTTLRYPYKFTKRHLLSESTKKKRLDRAKVLVKKLVDGMQPQVLWTDKKLFTVQAVHNHQNDRIWLPDINMVPVEHRSSFRRQKPASVMVWAGATSKGLKTPLVFIEEGVKINQTVYRRMLEEKVLPWVQEVVEEQGVTLQQDSATSHMANSVQAWTQGRTFSSSIRL